MAKGKRRDKSKEVYWQRKLQEHARSGLSIRAFCRQEKLTETAFHFWRREIARRRAERHSRPVNVRRRCERRQKPGRRRALGRQPNPRRDRAPGIAVQSRGRELFVPVRVTAEEPSGRGGEIAIALADGSRIHLTPPVDKQSLREILAVLEARPSFANAAEGGPC